MVQGRTFCLPVAVTLTHGHLASWFVRKVDIQFGFYFPEIILVHVLLYSVLHLASLRTLC